MSVNKMNVFLVALLHIICAVGLFASGILAVRGFWLPAFFSAVFGILTWIGLMARSLRLQEENDRFVGDFLDSVTPTIHGSEPVPWGAEKSVPKIVTWHGQRGKS